MLLFSYTVKIYMTQQIMRFALNVIINYTKLCDTVYYSMNVLELFLALDMVKSKFDFQKYGYYTINPVSFYNN